jgi:DNA-binding MarR family transcriptional regulator
MQHIPQEKNRDYVLSSLQAKILRIICTTQNVSYKTLIEETNRDRTTVLQSIESLIKNGYVEKQKVNPEYEKSKLIFKATPTGKQIASDYLDIRLEDIMKLEEDEQITNYLEFIKNITDPSQQKKFLQPLSDLLTSPIAWTSEGKIKPDEKREIIIDGFKEALLELFKNKNYDAKNLFNNKSIKWFQKLFTSNEIKEIKEDILQVVDNANLTIERFPDY